MPETEAEALLRAGALYPDRLGLRPADGALIFAGFKHGAFSLYFGDDPIDHFDLEGRWRRCHDSPSHHLRRLDGSTQAIDRPRVGRQMVLDRRTLGESEADAIDESIRSMALDLLGRLDSGAIALVDPPAPARPIPVETLRSMLGRIARWGRDAWAEHRRRYRSTYGPIPFLPPDSLEAIVLQATAREGNGPPRAKSAEAFREHCREVAELLGRGAVPHRLLFLAGPDALRRPAGEVEAYLRAALGVFPLADGPAPARRSDLPIDRPRREGFHAFLGGPEGTIPGPDAWHRFRSLGLRRVTVGIDPRGDFPPDDTITPRDELGPVVRDAGAAGIAISVVTWIGPGASEDLPGTAALFRSLGLGRGDYVYLVDGDERPGATPSGSPAEPKGDRNAAWFKALAPLRRESGAKVLPYSLRKQGI